MEITVKIEAGKDLVAALFALADAIDGRGIVPKQPETVQNTPEPAKNALRTVEKQPETTAPADPKPVLTLEQVRERLAPISDAKGSKFVKELLTQFGAPNLTKLDPAHYAALLEKAGA